MKQSFREADFDALVKLWNSFYPERFRIDVAQFKQSTVDSPLFDWGASCISMSEEGEARGFVAIKRSAASLYKGPDKDTAHLSAIAFGDPRIAVDLLAESKRVLRNRGLFRLAFGQDARHFFPGCPCDVRGLSDFLMIEGFEINGECFDLERDLTGFKNAFPIPKGDELRLIEEKDVQALDRFLAREFPGRWRYDVMGKVRIEGPGTVFGLFHGDEMDGFAQIQDSSCKMPVAGAVWHLDLGENWGSLGPIGVSSALRGKGSGNALLGAALENLAGRGVKRCIIDWTNLDKFYGGHGFEKTRIYKPMSLLLD